MEFAKMENFLSQMKKFIADGHDNRALSVLRSVVIQSETKGYVAAKREISKFASSSQYGLEKTDMVSREEFDKLMEGYVLKQYEASVKTEGDLDGTL